MIEPVSSNNLHEVLPLIRKYQEFYKVADISDSRNAQFFARFGPSSPDGCQFAFRKSDEIVGFSTVYFTYASTVVSKVVC